MKVLNVRKFEICHLLLKHIAELEKQIRVDGTDEEYVIVIFISLFKLKLKEMPKNMHISPIHKIS